MIENLAAEIGNETGTEETGNETGTKKEKGIAIGKETAEIRNVATKSAETKNAATKNVAIKNVEIKNVEIVETETRNVEIGTETENEKETKVETGRGNAIARDDDPFFSVCIIVRVCPLLHF